jgi:phosphatidylinositol kinase/protein kinase (PI-3  family)
MGPLGTDGTFTSVAEGTLRVLKQNSNALLTILSAIVSDPAYELGESAARARERKKMRDMESEHVDEDYESQKDAQNQRTVTRNEAGAHAIRVVQEKLQGYEDGTSGEQQSTEGQIQLVINLARDRNNLCQMHCGWLPWV